MIGHRGASGYRPEHTLAVLRARPRAWAPTTSSPTWSRRRTACWSRGTRTRSAARPTSPSHPEFAVRRTTKTIDGVALTGWFTEDFTLAELQTLRAKERIPRSASATRSTTGATASRRSRRSSTSSRAARARARPHGRHLSGDEAPDVLPLDRAAARAAARRGAARATSSTTAATPVFVQSFEIANLRALTGSSDVPLVQLLDSPDARPYDVVAAGGTRTYGRPGHAGGPARHRARTPTASARRRTTSSRATPPAARWRRRPSSPTPTPPVCTSTPTRSATRTRSCRSSCAAAPTRGLRQRVRRVRAVLRARRGRRVLRQPRHGARG